MQHLADAAEAGARDAGPPGCCRARGGERPPPGRRRTAPGRTGREGHVAALIVVHGQRSSKRADGRALEFVNFAAGSSGPAAMRGTWTTAELQAVIEQDMFLKRSEAPMLAGRVGHSL